MLLSIQALVNLTFTLLAVRNRWIGNLVVARIAAVRTHAAEAVVAFSAETEVDHADKATHRLYQTLDVVAYQRATHLQDRKLGVARLFHVTGVEKADEMLGPAGHGR